MSKEKENCNFPYWKPVNQLPYPAVKGMLLVTNSDFDLPARPDLLAWKTIESVIGVADIMLEINEGQTIYTLYKKVNNEIIEVGKIGAVSEENAEKLNKIDFVNYELIVNEENHNIKFVGIDKDEIQHELTIYDYIPYSMYMEDKNTINNRLDTLDTITDTLNDRLVQLATDLTALATRVDDINNTLTTIILPIINILRAATNPGLVLAKGSDGISLEWLNKLSMEDVTAEVNNVNQTITFKKTINGVTSDIITIDKVTLQQINAINNKLEPIDNTLNAYSNQDYILAKINNTEYDWHNPVDLIYNYLVAGDNITIEKVNNTIVITSTGGGGGDVTKAYVDEQDNLIRTSLQNEITRSTNKDNELTTNLQNEITRATTREDEIEDNVEAEVTRATNRENEINTSLQNEITRSTNKDNELEADKLDKTDFNDYLYNGLSAGDGISITRDTTNDTRKVKITFIGGGGYVTKAYVDEQDDLIKADLQTEITRATNRENEINTNLQNEITRSTTKDNELTTSLSNEVTRATTKENELETELENKIGYSNVVSMSYAEYQALETKDPNKFYLINDR